jgi:hypothetical protein
MSSLSPSLVWLCAMLAALPASPCRLIAGTCEVSPRAVVTETGSCCAEHSAPHDKAPANSPELPCSRQCCKAGAVIPVIHDSAVDAQLALSPLAFCLVPAAGAENPATFCEPLLSGRSLQIIHCRWRC